MMAELSLGIFLEKYMGTIRLLFVTFMIIFSSSFLIIFFTFILQYNPSFSQQFINIFGIELYQEVFIFFKRYFLKNKK
jgi:Ni,Fe-hydrogenase I cytochrome b subunit